MSQTSTPEKRPAFFTSRQLCERWEITRQHLARLQRQDDFPPPLVLSKQCRRWPRDDIFAWEKSRLAVDGGGA